MDAPIDYQPQLNRLDGQLKRLRAAVGWLAVVVVALAGYLVFTLVHKPKAIVLVDGDQRFELTARGFELEDGSGYTFLNPTAMQMHGKIGGYVALNPGSLSVDSGEHGTIHVFALADNARIDMLAGNGGLASWASSATTAQFSLSAGGNNASVQLDAKSRLAHGFSDSYSEPPAGAIEVKH